MAFLQKRSCEQGNEDMTEKLSNQIYHEGLRKPLQESHANMPTIV
jgi:hypothetical protein